MKKTSGVSTWVVSQVLFAVCAFALTGCASSKNNESFANDVSTPTVDYVESLDVYSAPHQDSFLNQLAMNYRSYAIYNARTSGYPEMGELFAQKAVAAFSGEVPFPETLDNWPVDDENTSFELYTAHNDLMEQLQNDASVVQPDLSAEMQAKYDCWLSATASGQTATAAQCKDRFKKALTALRDCKGGKVVSKSKPSVEVTTPQAQTVVQETSTYYPETRSMTAMRGAGVPAREGVIIVNNVNVPEHLINPVPVQPMVFNQNIYGGDKSVSNSGNTLDARSVDVRTAVSGSSCPCAVQKCESEPCPLIEEPVDCDCAEEIEPEPIPMIGEELVTREEFIDMMMAMRAELAAINARLDRLQAAAGEKTMIKVQQIPLEPKQHVMEEVFEVRFDFNKATIKPEYRELIEKLATATQENKNIKVSVVGHTDTAGSRNYNYALGGRRAEAVQKMLIEYGIPASQIVAVSSGEEDLAVPTPDNTPNAENRRVRVVKETHYTTNEPAANPVAIEVGEYSDGVCDGYGCDAE